jgi:hypothetical protein
MATLRGLGRGFRHSREGWNPVRLNPRIRGGDGTLNNLALADARATDLASTLFSSPTVREGRERWRDSLSKGLHSLLGKTICIALR